MCCIIPVISVQVQSYNSARDSSAICFKRLFDNFDQHLLGRSLEFYHTPRSCDPGLLVCNASLTCRSRSITMYPAYVEDGRCIATSTARAGGGHVASGKTAILCRGQPEIRDTCQLASFVLPPDSSRPAHSPCPGTALP